MCERAKPRTLEWTRRWLAPRGSIALVLFSFVGALQSGALFDFQELTAQELVKVDADKFPAVIEPPCSYCSSQDRKGLIRRDDPVLAWIRASHNGGAVPLRHFLAKGRVINDTYGLFFYDPDGGYVTAYEKDYGYQFHGWRGGVMVVQGKDGTLWSALTGRAIEGPQAGERLQRIPNVMTTWGHWLMLHPESTAYDLFDGERYDVVDLPTERSRGSVASMGTVDPRLAADAWVLGIESETEPLAIPLDVDVERACWQTKVDDREVVAFWYGPTRSAVAFVPTLDGQTLTFYADDVSPESAPFKDRETGSRWTLAGRAVDGPLRGQALNWVPAVQCRWFAWSFEFPQTEIWQADDHAQMPPTP